MNKDGGPGDVFAIPDLWGSSEWLSESHRPSGFLFSELRLDDVDSRTLPAVVEKSQYDEGFFSVRDITLEPIPVPDLEAPFSPPELESNALDATESDAADIWLFPEGTSSRLPTYQSWDHFENEASLEPQSAYLTEAGSSVFDATVTADRDYLHIGNGDCSIINERVYAAAILSLGLGRNSVLYSWDIEKRSFVQALPRTRISGYSTECLDALLSTFMDCGNLTRFLQAFVDNAYETRRSPGQIAEADAVSSLLVAIQTHLSQSAVECKSILQFEALFKPVQLILTCFERIVKNTSKARNDESLQSTIFEEIQILEHRTDSLIEILMEVLSRISRPWLEFVGGWLGLEREGGIPLSTQGSGKSFVGVADRISIDDKGIERKERDYFLNYDKVPSFIDSEDARSMFEIGRSLRFLKSHHPEHPLSNHDTIELTNPPSLEWQFSWDGIVRIEAQAKQYEKDLTLAIKKFSANSSRSHTSISRHSTDIWKLTNLLREPILDTGSNLTQVDVFELPPIEKPGLDRLSMVIYDFLNAVRRTEETDLTFSPPISLTPVLSFNPIITAQARIVNRVCMQMFFKEHKLRDHLSLQRNFQLLGNGVFSSKLSHALFDPDLESAERHRGVARSGGIMGLRLTGRDTWPPASSELRLALMGVLSESYDAPQTSGFLETSLPGDLSFAVRDMSEDEIEKCMNADSIEALDFLRISYTPPSPLEAVITPVILLKYDQVFKLLLRVIRMLYVVSALFRDTTDRTSQGVNNEAQRFRIEAHHFITSIAGYFFDTGIEATWRIFNHKLDQVEARLASDDNDATVGANEGLDKLRDYHERVLDRIMFALLLRKRQQPIMQLLQEIFTLILQFSKRSRERALGMSEKPGAREEVREIYTKFRKKVGVFLTVCRGLSERKGYGERRPQGSTNAEQRSMFNGDDLAEENTITHLLARFEMSKYYSGEV